MLPTGRALLDPVAVLKHTGLTLDMHYADFGCGSIGHFAFPAALMVGRAGNVYAVDILKGALAGIESRKRLETQAANVIPVWGDIEVVGGVDVPAGSVHVVSLVNIVAILRKSPTVFAEIRRVLVADGRLLLVGWKSEASALGIAENRRLPPEEIIPLATSAGFELLEQFEAGPHHWGAVFLKKGT